MPLLRFDKNQSKGKFHFDSLINSCVTFVCFTGSNTLNGRVDYVERRWNTHTQHAYRYTHPLIEHSILTKLKSFHLISFFNINLLRAHKLRSTGAFWGIYRLDSFTLDLRWSVCHSMDNFLRTFQLEQNQSNQLHGDSTAVNLMDCRRRERCYRLKSHRYITNFKSIAIFRWQSENVKHSKICLRMQSTKCDRTNF